MYAHMCIRYLSDLLLYITPIMVELTPTFAHWLTRTRRRETVP